jgi:hypothetical protein
VISPSLTGHTLRVTVGIVAASDPEGPNGTTTVIFCAGVARIRLAADPRHQALVQTVDSEAETAKTSMAARGATIIRLSDELRCTFE